VLMLSIRALAPDRKFWSRKWVAPDRKCYIHIWVITQEMVLMVDSHFFGLEKNLE
jgi:hypothetical protein